mmetsp:Transcript_177/g.432  ORF Transcript_177/g.432 Transcript_177/m.432 type:complete len:189 (+) Transcript_177:50-616(+)
MTTSTPSTSQSSVCPDSKSTGTMKFHPSQYHAISHIPRITPNRKQALPKDFSPSETDIVCGRGKQCYNHVGNKRFRVVIAKNLDRYLAAKTKIDKGIVVDSIVEKIRETGSFVKQDPKTKLWHEIGDQLAREKVSHALRDTLSAQQEAARREAKAPSKQSFEQKQSSLLELQRSIFRQLQNQCIAGTA